MLCPPGCDALTESLYGDQEYSSNSYICAAAIHDGKIESKSGVFVILFTLFQTKIQFANKQTKDGCCGLKQTVCVGQSSGFFKFNHDGY